MAMMVSQMPVVMAPHTATPVCFAEAMPPWAVQTPESSPMLWDRAPMNECWYGQPQMSMGQGVSKEYLRSVCEPFFDQMLAAVQQAVQAQQQCSQIPDPCWEHVPASMRQGSSRLNEEPSTEAGSDIVSDSGAFSSIFTAHSCFGAEEESAISYGPFVVQCSPDLQTKANGDSDDIEVQYSEHAEGQYQELVSEPPQGSDQEKSAMVCRHWKSKGWCRMGDNCKFLHPDHNCGVSSAGAKAGGISGDGIADMSNSLELMDSPSDHLAIEAMGLPNQPVKKRTSRTSKGKSGLGSEDISAW